MCRCDALHSGDHACQFFSTFAELKGVTLPFLAGGLWTGEACIYVTHDQTVDDWYIELQAYGVDVQRHLDDGSLLIQPASEWRQTGEFRPIKKAREFWALIDSMLSRHSGVRLAGNFAWALEPAISVAQLCHWESTASLLYEGEAIRAICQYDLTLHSAAALHAALRTHPLVILGNQIFPNAMYEVPKILENEPELFHSDFERDSLDAILAELVLQPEVI